MEGKTPFQVPDSVLPPEVTRTSSCLLPPSPAPSPCSSLPLLFAFPIVKNNHVSIFLLHRNVKVTKTDTSSPYLGMGGQSQRWQKPA